MLLAAIPSAPASAASPWWQVLPSSRPANLWVPQSLVQEIDASDGPFLLNVEGSFAGLFGGPFAEPTADNVQAQLETVYGAGNVEVTGGPGGSAPLVVTSIGDDARRGDIPLIAVPFGNASAKVVTPGGSGRLVVTMTNLGDAPVDGSSDPVTVVDELPPGMTAYGVAGFAGVQNKSGPLDCSVDDTDLVSCAFEGTLPSYEALEVEVFANLVGDPPAVSGPGKITVSGGNAPSASAPQPVKVSPEPTSFGIDHFSARPEEEGGTPAIQAGAHPFQLTTTIQVNSGAMVGRSANLRQPAMPRNLTFPLPAGLVGNASVAAPCAMTDFHEIGGTSLTNLCENRSAIGVAAVTVYSESTGFLRVAVPTFNLPPRNGEPARFGFVAAGAPVVIDTAVDPEDRYRVIASVHDTTQLAQFLGSTLTLWGTPGDPRHDSSRGWGCAFHVFDKGPCERPNDLGEIPFLRLPVACDGPLDFQAEMEPWNVPIGSNVQRASAAAQGLSGCNRVPFNPTISADPTSKLAAAPSGLDFELSMPNSGLLNLEAIAEGQPKKVEVTLPEGVTVNPSEGEGLVGCSLAQYQSETAVSPSGAGCPDASKIGSVHLATPLLSEEASGSLYVATPHENPSNTLLALYLVARIPGRGIVVRAAGKVEPDPSTGQLKTTFDDLPQLPFSSFRLHFREGARAVLVTPSACGTYETTARFTPWSASDPDHPTPAEVVTRTSSFTIERGVDGGACPSGGNPPFHPGLQAGTVNNAAGSYSPFNLRLTRNDGEQEFTNFSIKLPPGVIGKLAGIPFCPDAAIAAAKARTGPAGAQEELDRPSCPAASEVGRTLVGSGVGSLLTYVPGKLYLAGPYHGSQLSIAAITAAKVGPFDLGTVVIREALKINPETAEVFVDPTGSDPIPHIIQGIPVHARDIRVYVDRSNFVLNPTSCQRTSTASTVLGSGADFAAAADDEPFTVTSPFQAADCASLGMKPKLKLQLLGGTRRGSNPKLRATLTARKGDANIEQAQVTLPHSEFLDNSHIKTICTRVQFNAGEVPGEKCPKASIYGYAKATTPLLDKPIAGPVFLRSSSHPLPDLVAALHSDRIDVNLHGRIDSFGGGRIRTTFEEVPDAPVTRFVLTMQGGKKGLLINSTNICKGKQRAIVEFGGQNGKRSLTRPVIKPKCKKR
ncbi:MAG TPA: hypothetical protein VFX35_06330 [Solirubrobacterales bacterium]|nr:hypothetical protein [Solirubrobacterales bacterium]